MRHPTWAEFADALGPQVEAVLFVCMVYDAYRGSILPMPKEINRTEYYYIAIAIKTGVFNTKGNSSHDG